MRKRDVVAPVAVGWTVAFLFCTPRGDRIMRRLDRIIFPPWVTGEQKSSRPPAAPLPPILAKDCTGPHQCNGDQRRYCRESCTMCSGWDVRPCLG